MLRLSPRWVYFFQIFYLPEGINYAKKLNPTAAEDLLFPLLGFWCSICRSFKKKCSSHKIHGIRQPWFKDIQLQVFFCTCLASTRQRAAASSTGTGTLICWQPCVTASTRCGFSKHMTSMITSMGALNRFKFCTCVARQQHNRSPSLPPYMALYWDCCAVIIENG